MQGKAQNSPDLRSGVGSVLYQLEPKGLGTDQCESIQSYVHRLAYKHSVLPNTLYRFLYKYANDRMGLPVCEHPHWRDDHLISALTDTTANCDILKIPVWSRLLEQGFNFNLISKSEKYCPLCILENPYPDAWNRVIWQISWITACPVHLCQLTVPVLHLQHFQRGGVKPSCVKLPGVCPDCGSIGYQCNNQRPKIASTGEVWSSIQVGKIIAAMSGGKIFDSNVTRETFKRILISKYGSMKGAALFFKIGSRLSGLSRKAISVELLAYMGMSIGFDLLSLLDGEIETAGVVEKTKEFIDHAQKNPTPGLEKVLRDSIKSGACVSLHRIARSLQISSLSAMSQFPELTGQLVEMRAQKRYEDFGDFVNKLERLKDDLAEKGLPFTRRAAAEYTGKIIFPNSDFYKVFMDVLNGEI